MFFVFTLAFLIGHTVFLLLIARDKWCVAVTRWFWGYEFELCIVMVFVMHVYAAYIGVAMTMPILVIPSLIAGAWFFIRLGLIKIWDTVALTRINSIANICYLSYVLYIIY